MLKSRRTFRVRCTQIENGVSELHRLPILCCDRFEAIREEPFQRHTSSVTRTKHAGLYRTNSPCDPVIRISLLSSTEHTKVASPFPPHLPLRLHHVSIVQLRKRRIEVAVHTRHLCKKDLHSSTNQVSFWFDSHGRRRERREETDLSLAL